MMAGVPEPANPAPAAGPGPGDAPRGNLDGAAAQERTAAEPTSGEPAQGAPAEAEHLDAEALAALPEAIVELVRRLGGQVPPGTWDYQGHRIRIQHRPGAGISAMYKMPAGTGFAELGLSTEAIASGTRGVASTRVLATRRGAGVVVSGWIHPHDPLLPALALASDRARVRETWGEGDLLSGLRMVAYRPLRRAVLRATFTTPGPLRLERTIYLKVGRPRAIAALRRRHLLLAGTGLPVPGIVETPAAEVRKTAGSGSLAATANDEAAGVLALQAGTGVSLAAAIRAHAGDDLDPAEFIALLDALPASVNNLEPRSAWSDSLRRYLRAATLALPGHAGRLAVVAARIEEHLANSVRGPVVPAHGDFYDANILLQGSRISGLLDLDSLGPGHRVDDLACLLGHLAVLPTLGEKNAGAHRALERFGAVFEGAVDPRGLWARAAAVALTLIAGSRALGAESWMQVAEARLQVVEALVRRADRFA